MLTIHVGSDQRLAALHPDDDETIELFYRTEQPLPAGEKVWIRLVWPQGSELLVTGQVVWRRQPSRARITLPTGNGVVIDPSERPALAYIEDCEQGRRENRRQAIRLPMRMPVVYRHGSECRTTATLDISATGALLNTTQAIALKSRLSVFLRPPLGLEPVLVMGSVQRHSDDARGQAVGVEFEFHSEEQRARVAQLVADASEALDRGDLDERYLVC